MMQKQRYEEEIDLLEYFNVLKSKLLWIFHNRKICRGCSFRCR